MKSVGIRRFSGPYFLVLGLNVSPYFSVFSPNAGKYGPEKLRIRALFTLVIAKMVILHLLTILLSLHMKCLFSQKMFTTRKKKHFICSFSPLHATGLSLSLSLSLYPLVSFCTNWSLFVLTYLFLYLFHDASLFLYLYPNDFLVFSRGWEMEQSHEMEAPTHQRRCEFCKHFKNVFLQNASGRLLLKWVDSYVQVLFYLKWVFIFEDLDLFV